MIEITNVDEVAAKLAGVAGALVSMRYLQGSLSARLSMAASGSVVAYYASPSVAAWLGIPEGLSGFLIGVFGMAIVHKAWETLQAFPIAPIWQAVIDRVRGRGM